VLDPPKPPREGDGEPKYPHRPKPFMRSLASLFTRKLRQLRREFDGAMEEKIVSEYYGGKEGSVCRGVVTAVGGERRRDAIVQLMPGFVRAGLPEALQCPHDDPQVGQVRLGRPLSSRITVLVKHGSFTLAFEKRGRESTFPGRNPPYATSRICWSHHPQRDVESLLFGSSNVVPVG